MFFKALLAVERLHNKYLTLTTITHINLLSRRKFGYLRQIQTRISEEYFVELCLTSAVQKKHSSSGAGPSKSRSKNEAGEGEGEGAGSGAAAAVWTENDKEIDSNVLLE